MSKLGLPIGISDFKELIEQECYFVDKSQFIKDVISDKSKVMLFTRPRRFGKTLNLSMLYYFLTNKKTDIHPNLFNKTIVSKDREFCSTYQNQHPVIFISFKNIKELNFKAGIESIRELISDLFKKWSTFLEDSLPENEKSTFLSLVEKHSNMASLKKSLSYLCQLIYNKTNQASYLLIDEYDTPITAAYINGYYNEMIDLMRSLLGAALKDNIYLAKGVVTGITKISQESIFSGLNNLKIYSLLQKKHANYFGFIKEEVMSLLHQTGCSTNIGEIESWYDGYQVGEYSLYNPWSIISCIDNGGELSPYWLNTSDNALIKQQLSHSKVDVKASFIELLQDKKVKQTITESLVFTELKNNEEAVWSLLHAAGYLNVCGQERVGRRLIVELSIPNNEVKFVYDGIIENWFSQTISLSSYDTFVRSLFNDDIEQFMKILSSYLKESGSYFDFNNKSPEQVYHSFILGLVVGLRDNYIIQSNKEAGFGRYDVALIPQDANKLGVILEFKTALNSNELSNKAKEGLEQIKSKEYTSVFSQHQVKSVRLLSLAFYGKQVGYETSIINP